MMNPLCLSCWDGPVFPTGPLGPGSLSKRLSSVFQKLSQGPRGGQNSAGLPRSCPALVWPQALAYSQSSLLTDPGRGKGPEDTEPFRRLHLHTNSVLRMIKEICTLYLNNAPVGHKGRHTYEVVWAHARTCVCSTCGLAVRSLQSQPDT